MKTQAIVAAEIRFDDPAHPGRPFFPRCGESGPASAEALARAHQVFLQGNALPRRWQGRARFVVLETGFGLGHNFLATWAAWREDPQRADHLVYLAVDLHPPQTADLARAHAASPLAGLASALIRSWPPFTHDLHPLSFESGRVQLLLALGDVARWLPDLVASVDAFFLDGFAPERHPDMWQDRVFRACARLAAPGAKLATWSTAGAVRDGLSAAGFALCSASPVPDCPPTATVADWPPVAARRTPLLPPPGRRPAQPARHALVIGAGLAGAAAAQALARAGLQVTVLERRSEPAAETSGNPAGLFHGVVHGNDGAHAQLLRAATLRAAQVYGPLVAAGQVPGQVDGLLRARTADETTEGWGNDAALSAAAVLARQGQPASVAQWVDEAAAQALAGMPMAHAAWYLPPAGWISPAALVRHWLAQPGVAVQLDQTVHRLVPIADADASAAGAPGAPGCHGAEPGRNGWQALNAQGEMLALADLVVLANAHDLPRLLADWTDVDEWPWRRTRGQITQVPAPTCARVGCPLPHRPVASGGYAISLPPALGGGLLCGATQQADDDSAAVRLADHQYNLAQVARLSGQTLAWTAADEATLSGRVGWRLATDDRLPIVGPVPQKADLRRGAPRQEQARHVARVPGLYVLTALGSRGLTLAPLLGEVLAAWVTGAPWPLAASLLDGLDAARFSARAVRQAGRP